MSIDLTGLESAVTAEVTTADSLLAMYQTIKDQLIAELAGQPAAQAQVNAYMDALIANTTKMSDALAANVP